METKQATAYTVEGLSFSYGKNQVLNNISFSLPEGKITTFMGANGCGKSTLFNLLTKNLRPAAGSVRLRGNSLADIRLKDFSKQVSIVHQYNTAPPDLTVEKLVGYGRTPYHSFGSAGVGKEDQEKVRSAMEITHTLKYKDKCVSDLSGGQKQRVWIAMALAQDTDILFLDEPTTYLDIRYQIQILKLVQQLNRSYGITIVMVLHDINQALYFSDEVLALSPDGRVIAQGAPEEVIVPETIQRVYGIDLEVATVKGKQFVLTV